MASDALRDIFEEIHSLSAELKKLSISSDGNSAVLVATHSLLQTLVEHGPQTVPSIADVRKTSRQNIQVMADRLAQLGWVEFVPNPNHKKSELVRLTESGLAQFTASAKTETQMLKRLAARVSEQDLQEAQRLLRRLHLVIAEQDGPLRSRRSPHVSEAADASNRLDKPHGQSGSDEATSGQENKNATIDSGAVEESGVQSIAQQTPEDEESLPLNLL